MPLCLQLREFSSVPLEVEGVIPSRVRGESLAQIEQLPIFHGNRKVPLAEHFMVSGDPADDAIVWQGELRCVHWIGAKMDGGRMRVDASAGRHVGSEMSAGEITVDGDVSDWLGAELQGGLLRVRGNAAHQVGAAYRGSRQGMTGGTILVDGSAGNEVGHSLRRGLIAIGGACGDLTAFNLLAGTILVFGAMGIRPAAGMRRGTLGIWSPQQHPDLLPTFQFACRTRLLAVELLRRELLRLEYAAAADTPLEVDLYHGDFLEGGRGEVLVRPQPPS